MVMDFNWKRKIFSYVMLMFSLKMLQDSGNTEAFHISFSFFVPCVMTIYTKNTANKSAV